MLLNSNRVSSLPQRILSIVQIFDLHYVFFILLKSVGSHPNMN